MHDDITGMEGRSQEDAQALRNEGDGEGKV